VIEAVQQHLGGPSWPMAPRDRACPQSMFEHVAACRALVLLAKDGCHTTLTALSKQLEDDCLDTVNVTLQAIARLGRGRKKAVAHALRWLHNEDVVMQIHAFLSDEEDVIVHIHALLLDE